jgi:hypothetical protein
MSGKKPVRDRAGALTGHPLSTANPALASVVASALGASVKPGTQRGYDSAARSYEHYCSVHNLPPYPVDPISFVGWIVWMAMLISVASVKVYCAGVRSAQIDKGFVWDLEGNQVVARAMRYIKKRYGMAEKGLKVPVSLGTLLLMCARLAGWPSPSKMSHDDRLFVAASAIAVTGFLRGGEFLASKRSDRPVLRSCDVVLKLRGNVPLVEVAVARPKARWWLSSQPAYCFSLGSSCPIDPTRWLQDYRRFSVVKLPAASPAFVRSNGDALDRDWMVAKTNALLVKAGVQLVSAEGKSVSAMASSWRAGGVQSAKEAGVSDALIMAMGRWSSTAWFNYVFASLGDLQKASGSMWDAARVVPRSRPLVVGSFAPSGLFEDSLS